jgi:hypothetical protein
MSFIRKFKTKSGTYLAEVQSHREGGHVRQEVIRWIGKEYPLSKEQAATKAQELLDEASKIVNQVSGLTIVWAALKKSEYRIWCTNHPQGTHHEWDGEWIKECCLERRKKATEHDDEEEE